MFLVRPFVEDMVFQLYSRPLHPELFDIVARQTVLRSDFQARVHITRTGHMIQWVSRGRAEAIYFTEVVTAANESLPQGHLVHHRFGRDHHAQVKHLPGVTYQASFQKETLSPALFELVHEELLADGRRRGFIHHFPHYQQMGLPALGFVTMDGRPGCQVIHAFHTFPEELTIIKSQSLIEIAPA